MEASAPLAASDSMGISHPPSLHGAGVLWTVSQTHVVLLIFFFLWPPTLFVCLFHCNFDLVDRGVISDRRLMLYFKRNTGIQVIPPKNV